MRKGTSRSEHGKQHVGRRLVPRKRRPEGRPAARASSYARSLLRVCDDVYENAAVARGAAISGAGDVRKIDRPAAAVRRGPKQFGRPALTDKSLAILRATSSSSPLSDTTATHAVPSIGRSHATGLEPGPKVPRMRLSESDVRTAWIRLCARKRCPAMRRYARTN